jgi:hypothetical protein
MCKASVLAAAVTGTRVSGFEDLMSSSRSNGKFLEMRTRPNRAMHYKAMHTTPPSEAFRQRSSASTAAPSKGSVRR